LPVTRPSASLGSHFSDALGESRHRDALKAPGGPSAAPTGRRSTASVSGRCSHADHCCRCPAATAVPPTQVPAQLGSRSHPSQPEPQAWATDIDASDLARRLSCVPCRRDSGQHAQQETTVKPYRLVSTRKAAAPSSMHTLIPRCDFRFAVLAATRRAPGASS